MPSARAAIPSCWARSSLDLIRYATARGARPAELAARAPFDLATLREPEQRIPVSRYYDVIETVADVLADPLLGVSYIEQVEPAAIDAVGFLAMASRTLGEAMHRIIRHHRWITEGERFELDVTAGVACFSYTPWGPARPAHAHAADMYAADCMVLTPRMTGSAVQVLSFQLAHAPLADPGVYVQRLGALPTFNAQRNEWRLPAEVLERPMPHADPGLVQFFSTYLQARESSRGATADTRQQVRMLVCEALPERVPTLAQLAQHLHTSERSLQRRLAAEGSSLAALVDEVRRTRGLAYLEMQLPAAEVSMLLGYAEPAVFHRAFRRWTGQSTTAWRASRA
jgi:AraC-like DNA-binding protein